MQDIEDAYGLSATQKGMLFHTMYSPRSGVYVQQMIGHLREPLDILAFRRAWQQIAERHAVLRTSFSFERRDEPLQQVHQRVVLPFEEQDWQGLSDPEQDRRLKDYLTADRRAGFDLAKAPLMRLALFHLGEVNHRLVWTSHHALLDGRSRLVVLEELFALYEASCRGENLPLAPAPRFRAHIDWLAKQDFSHAEIFWRRELKGVSLPTPIGIESSGMKGLDGDEAYGSRTLRLSNSLTLSLNRLAEEHQLTLNTLLQGAWALLLGRYSGEDEVIFGATRVCRHSRVEGADSMVGVLINTVPVRVNISEERSLLPWLEELRAKWIAIRECEQTPLSKIQEWSEVPGSKPLFESLLVFENFELNAALRARARSFEEREFQLIGRTNYPLTISGHRDQQLLLKVDYDRNRFQDDSIARLLGHIETVLRAMVSNPGQRLADLAILTETECQQILVQWNDTEREYPRDKSIHELFEQQVERTPTAVAVVYEERQLTYRQLNERGNQLAHYLRKRGIGPDCLVGICLERSPDLIVAMIGILKTGGAYVPIDPSYPRERQEFMLADTRMRLLVADKQRFEQLPGSKAEVVCLNSDSEVIARECDQNPSSAAQPDSLAYVIYTSGSTGQPKGVAVPHRAVSRLVCNTNFAQLGPSDRVAQVSNCSFDAATFEIWGALLHGACLVGVAKEVVLSARHFANAIRDRKISTLFLTTSLFNQLASEIPQAFKTVTHLLFGGEAADPRWVKEILSQGAPCRLVNAYGPTESTTFATWHLTQQVQASAVTIPIGRPISNTQIYLMDARLRPVPVGVAGQLYIGGDGLARCYLNRPELTAERFVPHPFSTEPGARLYKTGDLVRYLPDGNIEFLGRADHQVKIRGFRIELGEIETALHQHPSVRQAVVLADEGPNGSKDLTGYVVPADHDSTTVRRLRDFLRGKLPDYMVPANFVFLDSVPLTPNGKLDRRGLAKLGLTLSEPINVSVAPRNRTEETLVRIWCQVLGNEIIGIYDNFFDLGGSSLLAMQVISNVWRSLGIDLPMRQLFDAPTVAGLAECIGNDDPKSRQLPGMPLRASHRNQEVPLSPRQKFCWDHKDIFVDKPVFNICRVVRLSGALQKEALQRALNGLIARHESLRTSFSVSPSGDPVQVIQLQGEVTLPLVDLSNLATPDRESTARSLTEEEGLIVFRLSESPLLRLKLIRLSQDEHWLVLVLSHFVADGSSLKVLFRELGTIYTAYCRNERPELPVLSIQFADYVLWQWQYLRSERDQLVSYWKQQLGGDLSGLKLPFDYPRPNAPTLQARRETVSLPRALRDSVSQLGKQQQATHSMVLLAAFKTLLYIYTGQVDIVTGASDANRSDIETADVIGLFTNITLFRSNLSGNPTFLELLHRVRNVVLDSYQHRGLSAELLEAECRRDTTNGDPMYQCRFLEAPDSRLELSMGELEVKVLPREQCQMRSDLRVFVAHTNNGIEMRWDYSTDLFKPETIHLMAQRYHSLLEQIVLSPSKRLSDFSLESLDKRQQTLSGKYNTREIEADGAATTHPSELTAPRTPTEEALVRIWRRVLGKERIGIHDNFFDLGGNSLLAMQVISAVWRSLEVDLPMRQLFDAPTVAGLAECVSSDHSKRGSLPGVPVTASPRNQDVPLSLRQKFCWDHRDTLIDKPVLNICRILRLRGALQKDALQRAFNDLIARHESLRTSFSLSPSGDPIQVIHEERDVTLPLVDLSNLATRDREKKARSLAEEEGLIVFRLAESPPFRLKLIRLSQDEHWLVLVISHFVADGWSLRVLFLELDKIYTAYCRNERPYLPLLSIQFADYVLWQRQYLPSEREKLLSYWNQQLGGDLSGLKLPFDYPRPKAPTFRAHRETVFLPLSLRNSLSQLGRQQQATEFMVLLAAFKTLLYLYTGQTDIMTNASDANRSDIETTNVIGFFSNVTLFRSNLSGNPTFFELLNRVRNVVLDSYQHRGLSLELLELECRRDDSNGDPLYQCSFSDAPDAGLKLSMGELEVEFLPREQCAMKQDLRVFAGNIDKGIETRWDYSADLFKPETIHLMAQRYHSLLEQIVLSPSKRLSDFSLDKRQQTLSGEHTAKEIQAAGVTTTHPHALATPRNQTEETLVRVWRQVLGKERIGIHDNFFDLGGNSLLAMQVISNLWRSLGVDLPIRQLFDAPTVAGLAEGIKHQESDWRELQEMPLTAVPRNQEMPVSLTQQRGLNSKNIYVEKGAGNIGRILRLRGTLQVQPLQDALNDLIARHESLRTSFPSSETGEPLQRIHPEGRISISTIDLGRLAPLDREMEARRLAEEEALKVFSVAESPPFRITLLRLSQDEHWMVAVIHHLIADGWSLKVLFQELGKIYTAHCRDEKPDLPSLPIQFADYAFWQRQYLRGDRWNQLVSYWKQRLSGKLSGLKLPFDHPRPKAPTFRARRETVFLPKDLQKSLSGLGRGQHATEFMVELAAFNLLLQLYTGQTDVLVGTATARRNQTETVNVIGWFADTVLFRSDLSGNPTFVELVARIRNVVLEAYQHQALPYLEVVKLVNWGGDSGSIPNQCCFAEAPDANLGAAMEGLEVETLPREQLSMRNDLKVFVGQISRGLEVRMDYNTDVFLPQTVRLMLQDYHSLLSQIVLSPNKRLSDFSLDSLDKRQQTLPGEHTTKDIKAAGGTTTHPNELTAPRNPTEEALVCVWRQVLRKERIGIHDNFFDLGGNSLLAMQLISNVWRSLGVDLPVRQLFDAPTVAGLGEIIKRQESEGRELQEMPLRALPRSQEIPVSHRQEFYLSVKTGVEPGWLNICRILRLRGSLQTNILQLAFNDLIARHESLRTAFEFTAAAKPIQVIHPERKITIPVVDLDGLAPLDKVKEARRLTEEEGTLAFRLAEDPLLRVKLIRISQHEHWLVLVIHHLVTDGWSLKVLFEELGRIYTEYSRGETPDLAPLPIQFADYALWERQRLWGEWDRLLCYWKRRLEGNLTGLKLPLDRARPRTPTLAARRETVFLPAQLQKSISELGREQQATKFIVLLAAFEQLLHLYTGQVDMVVGTSVANRIHSEAMGVVGSFSNLILLRSDLSGNPTFVELLKRVRNVALEGNQHQGPALELTDVWNWQDDSGADPRYQLRFCEAPDSGLELAMGELEVEIVPREQLSMRHDLRVFVGYTRQGIEVRWDYNTDLFTLETIHVMLQRYHSLLEQIVLNPAKRLSDFSLDSLDRRQQMLCRERPAHEVQPAAGATTHPPEILPFPESSPLKHAPPSLAQQRLWFLDQMEPGSSAYNVNQLFRLGGILHLDALQRALNAVVARHEILRTTFTSRDGEPVQVIAPALNINEPVIDLESFPERQVEAQQRAARQAEQPFDLRNGPLFRATLFRLAPTEHWLLLSVHHIVSDGWSLGVLQRELSAFYAAFSKGEPGELPELPIQYADYAIWQQRRPQGKHLDSQLAFWKQHLTGCVPVLRLPTDRPRPELQTYQGARQLLVLPKALASSLDRLSRQEGCTLFMTLLAAFNALLYRITLQEDIVVGVPAAGRTPETEGLIGFFVNTLPLRMNLSDGPSFRMLLHRVRANALEAYSHQDCPFEKLVEELHPERSLSHTPLFQVMLNVWSLAANSFTLPGLRVEMLERTEAKSKFDLTLYAWHQDEALRLSLVYNASLFDHVRMAEFLGQLRYLLEQVVEDPEKPLRSYSLVTPHFRTVLPDPAEELLEPPYEFVTNSFVSWAEQSPDHTAVCQGERTWSYKELSHSARRLALTLLDDGMSPGDVVVVTGPKSFGLVTSFMGIMMGAGVLLPLDPSLPPNRQRLLIQESRAKRICYIGEWCQEDIWMREVLPRSLSVDPDEGRVLETAVIGDVDLNKLPELSPCDPAYIFFTSGTTGVPKGVLGSHKGLSHFVTWQKETFGVGPLDRCAQLTNLSFDVVLRDIFLPLVSGATICLPNETDVTQVLSWLDRQRVTLLHAVPSLAEHWLATASEKATLRTLRWVFFAGEALSDTLVRHWREAFPNSGSVVNFYGPTETTMVKCFYVVPVDMAIGVQPVGKPLPQTQALVLTGRSQLCGLGEPGEIVLRTPFRCLGYINPIEEEQSRFARNPFRDDLKDVVYFTGDQGRYLPDGSLEILGRLDDQVKIRGIRVEPGEVTAILCQLPQVRTGIVVARKKAKEDILVAYVVPSSPGSVTATELKTFISKQLPLVMVPDTFVFLQDLPLVLNGKVDRNALPAPDLKKSDELTPFVGPRNPLEETIASIWCENLGLMQVGIHDNFFDLGGHSLLAMKLSSKMSAATNHVVSVRSLFLYPNIAALTEALVTFPALNGGEPTIRDVSGKHPSETNGSKEPLQPSSPYLKIERRSLLSLLGVGKIAPVHAAAIGCLPHLLLAEPNVIKDEVVHDWYEDMPVLNAITETSLGRIGVIRLPRFRWELYNDTKNLLDLIVEALELARQIGARTVSLTGLIPSATEYGEAIARRIKERPDLPRITTGHATTAATVALSVLRILEESRRDLTTEKVGFLGLGSIGTTALRLMLKCLPHPHQITLCDIYSKLNSLESIRKELVDDLGFRGSVSVLGATAGIPQEFYESTLIVGATNVPDVLDIERVSEGALIVDDSAPHCFKTADAVQRFLTKEDILFTQGGTLQAPDTVQQIRYLPRQMEQKAPKFCREVLARYEPFQITGCIFSSLLSAHYEDLKPTVGLVGDDAAWQHYQRLLALGFRAFALQCENYMLPQAGILNFRRRFGGTPCEEQQPGHHLRSLEPRRS